MAIHMPDTAAEFQALHETFRPKILRYLAGLVGQRYKWGRVHISQKSGPGPNYESSYDVKTLAPAICPDRVG